MHNLLSRLCIQEGLTPLNVACQEGWEGVGPHVCIYTMPAHLALVGCSQECGFLTISVHMYIPLWDHHSGPEHNP